MSGNRTKTDARAELVKFGIPPRLLDLETIAAYVGLSAGAFLKAVADGRYPPAHQNGKRRLWDRLAVDAAVDRRSGIASSLGATEGPDPIMQAIDEG